MRSSERWFACGPRIGRDFGVAVNREELRQGRVARASSKGASYCLCDMGRAECHVTGALHGSPRKAVSAVDNPYAPRSPLWTLGPAPSVGVTHAVQDTAGLPVSLRHPHGPRPDVVARWPLLVVVGAKGACEPFDLLVVGKKPEVGGIDSVFSEPRRTARHSTSMLSCWLPMNSITSCRAASKSASRSFSGKA